MKKTVTCKKCGSVLEYDDKSIWEGNRENEELECPVCKKCYRICIYRLDSDNSCYKQCENNAR